MIKIHPDRCTGCHRCETACAFFHSGKVHPGLSRIKVYNAYATGVDAPVLCQQCRERYCLRCPEKALSLGAHGQIVVSPTVCTECRFCEAACPIGAIELFEGFVIVCDLCGGRPRCIDVCTEHALEWIPDAPSVSLDAMRKETKGFSPSRKRAHFTGSLGVRLRRTWSKNRA